MSPTHIDRIRELQGQLDALREQHGISAPGAEIYEYPHSIDRTILVLADGFGGAAVLCIEGSSRLLENCQTHAMRHFESEADALACAESVTDEDELNGYGSSVDSGQCEATIAAAV